MWVGLQPDRTAEQAAKVSPDSRLNPQWFGFILTTPESFNRGLDPGARDPLP